MRFFNRENEIKELKRIQSLAFHDHSQMTVVTGRRRIGKTSLITQALTFDRQTGSPPVLYLFVSRKTEAALCREFAQEASMILGVFIPMEISRFADLFRVLIETAIHTPYSLVIDEFQEFFSINQSIFSDMQNQWDRLRKTTKLNLIICGSVYSLMNKIFKDSKEPLFGRADNIIEVKPFPPSVIKTIISEGNDQFTNDDLLALFTVTGGVPKYIELLYDNQALTVAKMIDFMMRENSIFIDEGRNLLITEFGKNYSTYFTILQAVSDGVTTQNRIEDIIGEKAISGHLKRLVDDYHLLTRRRPIFAKPGSQAVRFEIEDNFLRFWFAYFEKHRSLIELGNFATLREIAMETYPTYSGLMLERYFKQKLAESNEFVEIGSWWESRSEQNEIDIVAVRTEKHKAIAAEVKRNPKSFRISQLTAKVEHLRAKAMQKYEFETRLLSLDDM